MNKIVILLTAVMVGHTCCYGQQNPQGNQATLQWWGNVDEFLNQQSIRTFDLIDQVLDENQPQIKEPVIRKMALLSLDNLLHDTKNDQRPALGNFFQKRIKNIVDKIRTDRPEKGAIVYKLYNHTFIVRTKSATIAFDLVSNESSKIEGLRIPDAVIKDIVNACDILLVTHLHDDHADSLVARMFVDAGKPVVTSPDLWNGMSGKILYPARGVDQSQSIRLANGKEIKVRALPGHQGSNILNNVYAVTTPDGLTFVHTGDQSNTEDLNWIDKIHESVKVDVLLVNSWTRELVRAIKGFNPGLVVTGHENEMGHSIDHREPYWLTYERLKGNTYPSVLMSWGEKFHFDR